MRARIIRAYIAKPKNIPLISLISQQTVPRDKRDKRVIFPLDSHIYARAREEKALRHKHFLATNDVDTLPRFLKALAAEVIYDGVGHLVT